MREDALVTPGPARRPPLRDTGVRWVGLRELAIFAAAYLTYFGVRALTQGSVADAIANAASIDRFERVAGIDREPALQTAILDHDTLVRIAN
jgi:hypothetical protein